jgi:hypothetical protein
MEKEKLLNPVNNIPDYGLHFRWAKAAEVAFGDGDFHREIVARQIGL